MARLRRHRTSVRGFHQSGYREGGHPCCLPSPLQASRSPRHSLNLCHISSWYIPLKYSSRKFPLTYISARLCPLLHDHHCPIHSTSFSPLCHDINTSTTPLSHPLYF